MTKETYIAVIKCHNCKHEYTLEVPFSTLVDSYYYENECLHCGCYIIKRKKQK